VSRGHWGVWGGNGGGGFIFQEDTQATEPIIVLVERIRFGRGVELMWKKKEATVAEHTRRIRSLGRDYVRSATAERKKFMSNRFLGKKKKKTTGMAKIPKKKGNPTEKTLTGGE